MQYFCKYQVKLHVKLTPCYDGICVGGDIAPCVLILGTLHVHPS